MLETFSRPRFRYRVSQCGCSNIQLLSRKVGDTFRLITITKSIPFKLTDRSFTFLTQLLLVSVATDGVVSAEQRPD